MGEALEEFGETNELPMKLVMEVTLALDELVTNVITHAYKDGPGEVAVIVRLADGVLHAEGIDDGPPFDPLAQAAPDTSLSLEDREIGGLGLHLVRTMMDEVEYSREDDRNHVRLQKRYG